MPPNKSKRSYPEESPETDKMSKRPRLDDSDNDDEEDDDKILDEDNKASFSKMRSPTNAHKPAELFRKDLISAMKLADSEPLAPEEYLFIADPWRQDWEKGVQVPVNAKAIPEADIKEIRTKDKTSGDFKIPRKYLHAQKDDTYQGGIHELTGMQQLSEQVVRYDLDDLDVCWLQKVNEEREELCEILIHEWTMERVIEALESQCHENIQKKKKTEEGLGIEYDEDVVCEVCRCPDSEENNEMVFCDGCDICIHQACYGIQKIPEGSYLCRTCALGIKPSCILCPKSGGAMKSTRSGTKWAHVSCALWIPEVSIGCVEKMEPITKISQIPASRWGLICVLCKERTGACIQCSVKACKTAFHVSCAFSHNLEMKTVLTEDEHTDGGIKLKAYCPRHSKKRERGNSESDTDSPRKSVGGTPHKLTDEEIAKMRAEKLKQLEEEFYTVVDIDEISKTLDLDSGVVETIFVYWKLKRKVHFDTPLLTPKTEEEDLLEKQQEDSLVARMKMFVQLRQDLERVRNLCYMVSKREKIKKQFYKLQEKVFMGQVRVLTDKKLSLTEREAKQVARKFNFSSIYDVKFASTLQQPKSEPPSLEPVEEDVLSQPSQDLDNDESEDLDVDDSMPPLQNVTVQSEEKVSPLKISGERHSKHLKKNRRNSSRKISISKTNDIDNKSVSGDVPEMLDVESVKSELEESAMETDNITDVTVEEEIGDIRRELRDRKKINYSDIPEEDSNDMINSRALRSTTVKQEPVISEGITNCVEIKSNKAHKVSDRIKNELDFYIKTNQLVVSDKIKDKVERGLLKSKNLRSRPINGIHERSPKKFDSYFRNGRKSNSDSGTKESPFTLKNSVSEMARVLHEISPGRVRATVENGYFGTQSPPRGSLSGYRIPKKTPSKEQLPENKESSVDKSIQRKSPLQQEMSPIRETRSVRRRIDNIFESYGKDSLYNNFCSKTSSRSSRENSPDVISSNLRLVGNNSHGLNRSAFDTDRILTRASSPASSNKSMTDIHSDVDVENLYHDNDGSVKRVTRSQATDDSGKKTTLDLSRVRSLIS